MTTEGLDALRARLIATFRANGMIGGYVLADQIIAEVWSAACQQQRAGDVAALRQVQSRSTTARAMYYWGAARDLLASLPLADTPAKEA